MYPKQLLFDIAHCPIVNLVFNSHSSHPCERIIESQNASSLPEFQLPELWSGQIESAPILFLSSNPSIDPSEDYPTWFSSDELVEDFSSNRFAGKHKEWVKNGKHFLKKNGSYSQAVSFWSAVRKRSEELFQREVIPGVDYALSEIVHCKSRQEIGVSDAMRFCSERYLKRILMVSGAIVVVILGDKAKVMFKEVFNISDNEINKSISVNVGNKERYICSLPHPNARKKRTFDAVLSPDVLLQLRVGIQSI
jgi:hypothetical protein